MNPNNDFYRPAKEGEKPTHVITNKGEMLDFPTANLIQVGIKAYFVKVGWFSPDEKPEKDGEHICVVEDKQDTCKAIRMSSEGDFYKDYDEIILAWAHLPPFEQEKEEWEYAYGKAPCGLNTDPKEVFKYAFLAGQKSRETK